MLSTAFVNGFSQTTSYKFDFGTDKTVNGYIAVTPNTIFSKEKGYGFEAGSTVEAIDRGGNAVTGDYITSTKPLLFFGTVTRWQL